ncbi:MAG: hypothetical protein ABIW46_07070, partial [Acidimicrobiales bacterium]
VRFAPGTTFAGADLAGTVGVVAMIVASGLDGEHPKELLVTHTVGGRRTDNLFRPTSCVAAPDRESRAEATHHGLPGAGPG